MLQTQALQQMSGRRFRGQPQVSVFTGQRLSANLQPLRPNKHCEAGHLTSIRDHVEFHSIKICDNLTATVAPSIDSIGFMVLSLATIMLVWFGVKRLFSAQGGPGFSGKVLNFFLLITFVLLRQVLRRLDTWDRLSEGLYRSGTSSLLTISAATLLRKHSAIHTSLAKAETLSVTQAVLLCTYTVQIVLSVLTALSGDLAYGAIAQRSLDCSAQYLYLDGFRKTEFCSGDG